MAAQTGRTQAERRNQSENALLKAAVEVIASAGVGNVTFEALGKSSGYSRGLASVWFGSKAKLIEAVLQHLNARQETLVIEHRFDDLPGLDAVLAFTDLNLREVARRKEARAYFMLLSSSVADATDMRSTFAATHAQVKERLRHWITKGQAQGTIKANLDADTAALLIGCLTFGLSMQLIVDPSVDCATAREACLALLRDSLATPSRRSAKKS